MARKVRGVLVVESIETGDGRVIAAEANEWATPPLPIAWLQKQQHGDLLDGAVAVGTFSIIARSGSEITFEGEIDDERPEGAEMIRRMESGTAPGGHRHPLSIDPDNWAVQIVVKDRLGDDDDADEMVVLTASGTGGISFLPGGGFLARQRALRAAAGDPDQEPNPEDIWFEDESGMVLERYTRLRIRGVTACDIGAFHEAYMELVEVAAETGDEPPAEEEPEAEATIHVPALLSSAPPRPPSPWFAIPEPMPGQTGMVDVYGMPVEELLIEQPDGGFGVPLTIADGGRVFGHAFRWGQFHRALPGRTPPHSPSGYAHFHLGQVVCDDGVKVATGALFVGCDHPARELMAPEARDGYAHTGLAFADVRVTDGEWGGWVSGALRPQIGEPELRVLRASTLSGDWRVIGNQLEFITALAVNAPGFPILRESLMASAIPSLPALSAAPSVHFADGEIATLLASGAVQRCAGCAERARQKAESGEMMSLLRGLSSRVERMDRTLGSIDLRTRHMRPAAKAHTLERLRIPETTSPNGDKP